MPTTILVTFKVRGDTAANWASVNPVLADREIGYDKTNKTIKVGDGSTTWTSLAGISVSLADDQVTNAKLANMAQATIKGRASGAGTGDPTDLTPAQVRAVLELGTAALESVGTSGNVISKLNAANTWSALQTFGAGATVSGTLTAAASSLGGAATFSFSTAAAATEFIRLSATGNAGAARGPFISFYPPNNSNSSLFQGSIGAYGNTGGGVQINGPSNTQVARFPDAGAVITGSVTASSYIKPGSFTVATLPSAATAGAGARAYVTDANATTFNTIVAGGGANKIPVTSDGANWKIG
jgi:hypothetical protein